MFYIMFCCISHAILWAIPPLTKVTIRQVIFILQEKLFVEKLDIFSD